MSLLYIIDAYNIINHTRFSLARKKIRDPQKALLEFINIRILKKRSRNEIIVVFDGYPKVSAQKLDTAHIKVVFSQEKTADSRIKRMVEASKNPRNIVVVSDDREIKFFIKSMGARSIGVEEFIIPKAKLHHKEIEDLIKPELSYSQVHQINEELKTIWLKD